MCYLSSFTLYFHELQVISLITRSLVMIITTPQHQDFFWSYLQHVEVPGPGNKPVPQQQHGTLQ